MFTNYDAQQVLDSQNKLANWLESNKDISAGSGETTIHKHALKQILHELFIVREASHG